MKILLVVIVALLTFGITWTALELRSCEELRQANRDVLAAQRWARTGGTEGMVTPVVIDACAQADAKARRYRRYCASADVDFYFKACPVALIGVIRFYSELGGSHGCAQVRRALEIYQGPQDETILAARAKCR